MLTWDCWSIPVQNHAKCARYAGRNCHLKSTFFNISMHLPRDSELTFLSMEMSGDSWWCRQMETFSMLLIQYQNRTWTVPADSLAPNGSYKLNFIHSFKMASKIPVKFSPNHSFYKSCLYFLGSHQIKLNDWYTSFFGSLALIQTFQPPIYRSNFYTRENLSSFPLYNNLSLPCRWKWPCGHRADSRLAPSQWETALLCNDVSHWLGTSLESALRHLKQQLAFLTHLGLNQISPHFADIFKCIFLRKNIFRFKFHWSLFLRVQWVIQLSIIDYWYK